MLVLSGLLAFSFVATSCGDDDEEDPVEIVNVPKITNAEVKDGAIIVTGENLPEVETAKVGDLELNVKKEGNTITGTPKDGAELPTGEQTVSIKFKGIDAPLTTKVTIPEATPTIPEATPTAEIVKVKVTFDTDGGSEVAEIEVEKGKAVSVEAPTKEGYTFKGWATEKGGEVKADITVDADTTLYAVWEQSGNNDVAVAELALDLSTIWSQFCDVTNNADGSVTLKMSKGEEDWQKGEFGFAIPTDKQGGNYKKIVVKYKDATAQDGIGCVFHFDSESVGWANGEAANSTKLAFEAGSDVKTLTITPDAPADKLGTVRIFDYALDNTITIVSVTAVIGE